MALAIPICSTKSVDMRIPAVSAMETGYPPKSIQTSTISLVVPAIGETMAACRLAMGFNGNSNELQYPAYLIDCSFQHWEDQE